jgi:hypothetical protein
MKTFAWLKLHWKGVLIIIGVFLFLISVVSNCKQNGLYQQIKKDHAALKAQQKLDQHKIDSLNKAYKASQLAIDVLNVRSDSIKKASDKIIADTRHKESVYIQTIADLKNVPPDTVYKRIFAYNPNINNDLLQYPFGAGQIKVIYGDYLALNYNLGLVSDLNKTYSLCQADNQTKVGVILQKDKQIGSLSGQLKVNGGLINTLTSDNKILGKSVKGEHRWKIIWRTTSLVELGGIGVLYLTR